MRIVDPAQNQVAASEVTNGGGACKGVRRSDGAL